MPNVLTAIVTRSTCLAGLSLRNTTLMRSSLRNVTCAGLTSRRSEILLNKLRTSEGQRKTAPQEEPCIIEVCVCWRNARYELCEGKLTGTTKGLIEGKISRAEILVGGH